MKPGLYRHYKGGLYDVQELATLEANEVSYVVYRQLLSGRVFLRPTQEFFGTVNHQGKIIPRYTYLEKQVLRLIRVGGIIRSPNNKVVIVNQRGNSWSLPKGGVEAGEWLMDTLKREVQEETGLIKINIKAYLGMYERYPMGPKLEDVHDAMNQIHLFAVTSDELPLHPSDPHNPEARWVTPQEASKMLTHRLDREAFERFWQDAQPFFSASV